MATVGAKVICVILGEEHNRDIVIYPKVGAIYTIRELIEHPMGGIGIRLTEIENAILPYAAEAGSGPREYCEASWRLYRFRPLVTRSHEEDMTVFRKIASNLPTAKELEDSVQLALERLG